MSDLRKAVDSGPKESVALGEEIPAKIMLRAVFSLGMKTLILEAE